MPSIKMPQVAEAASMAVGKLTKRMVQVRKKRKSLGKGGLFLYSPNLRGSRSTQWNSGKGHRVLELSSNKQTWSPLADQLKSS